MVANAHTTAQPPTSVMNSRRRMSASDEAAGPRQTSILKEYVFGLMSALLPKADIVQHDPDVYFVPKADIAPGCGILLLLNSLLAATAASIASPRRSTIASIVPLSMMNGGARRTWSPRVPSTVPPIG